METINFYQVKKILGIRNRFWRKKIELLRPELMILYRISLKRNNFPIWMSIRKTIHKKNLYSLSSEQIVEEFYKNLVKYLNLYKQKNMLLHTTQKAKMVRIQKNIVIVIQNQDGSEDFEKRKKLQIIIKRILEQLQKETATKEKIENIFFYALNSNANFYIQEKDQYVDLLESPIGKIISKVIPGFDILLEIQKYKEKYQEENFLELLQWVAKKNIKHLIFKILYSLIKNFPNYGKIIAYPVAITSDSVLERYERYQSYEHQLKKNFQKLLWIKKSMLLQKN